MQGQSQANPVTETTPCHQFATHCCRQSSIKKPGQARLLKKSIYSFLSTIGGLLFYSNKFWLLSILLLSYIRKAIYRILLRSHNDGRSKSSRASWCFTPKLEGVMRLSLLSIQTKLMSFFTAAGAFIGTTIGKSFFSAMGKDLYHWIKPRVLRCLRGY